MFQMINHKMHNQNIYQISKKDQHKDNKNNKKFNNNLSKCNYQIIKKMIINNNKMDNKINRLFG